MEGEKVELKKVIFLDRDGVINRYPGDGDYVKSWEEFHFLPGVMEALKRLQDAGYSFFIISNQAGVAKGIYSQEALDEITRNMLRDFERQGIILNGVYYCTHLATDNCPCRKPNTGYIEKALEVLRRQGYLLDRAHSFFIGDTMRDIETGKNAGLKTILVFSGKEKRENLHTWQILPDFCADDLSAAVKIIIS